MLDRYRESLLEEILLLSYKANIPPEYTENLNIIDRKHLIDSTMKIIRAENPQKDKAFTFNN